MFVTASFNLQDRQTLRTYLIYCSTDFTLIGWLQLWLVAYFPSPRQETEFLSPFGHFLGTQCCSIPYPSWTNSLGFLAPLGWDAGLFACLPSPRLTPLLQASQGPGQSALISRIPCPAQHSSCSSMLTLTSLYSHPLVSPSVHPVPSEVFSCCNQGGSLSCLLSMKLGWGKDIWKYQTTFKTSSETSLLDCIVIILFKSKKKKSCYPTSRLTMVQKYGCGFHQVYCRSGSMQQEGS